MSLAAACGWTFLRSLCVVLLALPVMHYLSGWLRSLSGASARVAWIGLLAPFFSPELLVGYAYSNFSLSLIRYPVWNELLYGAIVLFKFAPVGTLAILFAPPPPLSAEGRHCRRLLRQGNPSVFSNFASWLYDLVQGPARAALVAGAIVFLLTFQEFEIGSLLGTVSWTTWLFDAQAGGLMLSESWRLALVPLAWEAAFLVPSLGLILLSGYRPVAASNTPAPQPRLLQAGAGVYLILAIAAMCLVPGWICLRSAGAGLGLLLRDPTLLVQVSREILQSGTLGIVAGAAALAVSTWLVRPRSNRNANGNRFLGALVLSLPGLFGPLILCLSLLHLFQVPGLVLFRDTPLVLIVALVLCLLPRAVLLQLVLQALRSNEGLHLSRLLSGSPVAGQRHAAHELNWDLRFRPSLWGLIVLSYWGYLDLTATSLLAPTGMVSAPVRLYNLMHYGQSALLSGMLSASIAAPLVLISIITLIRRPIWRLLDR